MSRSSSAFSRDARTGAAAHSCRAHLGRRKWLAFGIRSSVSQLAESHHRPSACIAGEACRTLARSSPGALQRRSASDVVDDLTSPTTRRSGRHWAPTASRLSDDHQQGVPAPITRAWDIRAERLR